MAGKPNQEKTLVPKMTQYNQNKRETMVGLPGNELLVDEMVQHFHGSTPNERNPDS